MTGHDVLNSSQNKESVLRRNVLLFAVLVAVFYGVWFGIVSLKAGNHALAAIDFCMAGLFMLAGYVAVNRPESSFPALICASSTSIFFLYLFASGGIAGNGPLWSLVLPLIVFFLTGFRGGVIISLSYLAACLGIFCYNLYVPGFFYAHSLIFIERFVGIFLLATVVSAAYEFQKLRTEAVLVSLLKDVKLERDRAEAANEAKSSFLAMVSHEIRNPVNGINGMLELLLDSSLNEKQKKYAELMRCSCDTLLTLIKDILDLSKIESGKMLLERKNFNLLRLVQETIALLQIKAQQKNFCIRLEFSDQLPESVSGDSTRLKQVLTNLIDNAVKFTAAGEVLVRVRPEKNTDNADYLMFEVIDTGIGIAGDKLSALFQDYNQADSSIAGIYGGSGLGLAISRRLTQMMGGEIGVNSKPDNGSRFFFRIPLHLGTRIDSGTTGQN